nr:unnamed protein product [Callosobruchus chinensis]
MKSAKPVLAGDFIIDILKDNTSKQNFISVLNEYDLKTTVKAKVHYKTLKNLYVKLLQKSKSELIKSKIDSADNKSQAMWLIINKLTGKNNPSKIFPEVDLIQFLKYGPSSSPKAHIQVSDKFNGIDSKKLFKNRNMFQVTTYLSSAFNSVRLYVNDKKHNALPNDQLVVEA